MSQKHPNQRALHTLPKELRRTNVPPQVRAWIERVTGNRVVKATRLPGASSTAIHRIHFSSPNDDDVVLRRYVWPGFLEDEPIAPQRELDALLLGGAQALPMPRVVAADVTGDDVGDGVPVLLMSFLRGRAVAAPDASRMAEVAATIHAADPGTHDAFSHDYFFWFEGVAYPPPATAFDPKLWERAKELRATAMPPYRPAFIHRDLHPGNVLWSRGRCTGVVDWPNACRGPAGCDVATCRGELIRLAGFDLADRFRDAYEAITGEAHHPYWEISNVLEHGPGRWTPQQVADAELRLKRALAVMTA